MWPFRPKGKAHKERVLSVVVVRRRSEKATRTVQAMRFIAFAKVSILDKPYAHTYEERVSRDGCRWDIPGRESQCRLCKNVNDSKMSCVTGE